MTKIFHVTTPALTFLIAFVAHGAQIKFATDIPAEQSNLLMKDLQVLQNTTLKNPDAELIRVMNLPDATTASLQQWLGDRIQYVTGENFDLEKSLTIEERSYKYENPDKSPVFEKNGSKDFSLGVMDNSNKKVVMSNQGAVVYTIGKSESLLLGVKIAGLSTVLFSSPRVGLLVIGSGLFHPFADPADNTEKNIDTPMFSYYRLGTLFHEARHSDGNGTSLGFFHAVCPKGHEYADLYACDRNLNGPYTVGGQMLMAFSQACEKCSIADKELLKTMALDAFSRIIKITPKHAASTGSAVDASLAEVCADYEKLAKQLNLPASDACKNISPALGLEAGEGIPSTDWDDKPEGHR